jgi:hypothetical protein
VNRLYFLRRAQQKARGKPRAFVFISWCVPSQQLLSDIRIEDLLPDEQTSRSREQDLKNGNKPPGLIGGVFLIVSSNPRRGELKGPEQNLLFGAWSVLASAHERRGTPDGVVCRRFLR